MSQIDLLKMKQKFEVVFLDEAIDFIRNLDQNLKLKKQKELDKYILKTKTFNHGNYRKE